MKYEQLRKPDLTVKDKMGYCLRYARSVFSINPKYYTARIAWDKANYKHYGTRPTNVAVPVWYSWKATLDGKYQDWGHVAINVPGKGVYSSPIRSSQVAKGYAIYKTPESLGSALGAKYLGWSEDINGVRVVRGEEMYKNKTAQQWYELYVKWRGYRDVWAERAKNAEQKLAEALVSLSKSKTEEEYLKVQDELKKTLEELQKEKAEPNWNWSNVFSWIIKKIKEMFNV